jgi:hypothetical protein
LGKGKAVRDLMNVRSRTVTFSNGVAVEIFAERVNKVG